MLHVDVGAGHYLCGYEMVYKLGKGMSSFFGMPPPRLPECHKSILAQ